MKSVTALLASCIFCLLLPGCTVSGVPAIPSEQTALPAPAQTEEPLLCPDTLDTEETLDGMTYLRGASWAETDDSLADEMSRIYEVDAGRKGSVLLRIAAVHDEETAYAVEQLRLLKEPEREAVIRSMMAAKEGTFAEASSRRGSVWPAGTRAMWTYEGTTSAGAQVRGAAYISRSQLYEISFETAQTEASAVFAPVWEQLLGTLQFAKDEPASVQIDAEYCILAPGEISRLSLLTTGGLQGVPVWSSSSEAVAVVAQDGTVTGINAGMAWITLELGDAADQIAVSVTEGAPDWPPSIQVPRFRKDGAVLKNPHASGCGEAVILLTGDLMALSSQQAAAKTGATYDYTSSFSLVAPLFFEGDLVIGNLETCLSYSSPSTAQEKTVQGNPHCNAQGAFAEALRYAGYDVVVTANNHCQDTGAVGICETLQTLDTYGLAHTGTFSRRSGQRFLLADVNGIRIALLSYTELINIDISPWLKPGDSCFIDHRASLRKRLARSPQA